MNRKRGIVVFIMLLAFAYVQGQDKIITTQQDTIFCKIVSISLKFIKYQQGGYAQVATVQSIPMERVREYSLGASLRSQESFPITSNKVESTKPWVDHSKKQQSVKPVSFSKKQEEEDFFQRWRIGFQGGASYLLNSLAPLRQQMKDLGVFPTQQADDYYKALRNGLSAGVDAYYLFTTHWGVGLKYSFFLSSIQKNYSTADNSASIPTYYNVNEKEQIYLNYVGPSVFFRQWLNSSHKFSLSEELSVGYIFYRDKIQFDPYQYVFSNPETNEKQYNVLKEKNTFSGIFQLSLDYYPIPSVSIGVNGGFVGPTLFRSLQISDNTTSNETNLGKSHQLDLSRIDCSLGVRFHF